MPRYETPDPGDALDQHVRRFFADHQVERKPCPPGPMESRIPGFFLYEVSPGPRFSGWTYVSSGCWRATTRHGHGLEFVLSTNGPSDRHVLLMAMNAYYHAGPENQRLDLGHTVPIGEPWMAGGLVDHWLISLPYAYGPELEQLQWQTGHARLLALMPITTAERNLKAQQGVDALEQRLEEQGVDFANPLRGSAI